MAERGVTPVDHVLRVNESEATCAGLVVVEGRWEGSVLEVNGFDGCCML